MRGTDSPDKRDMVGRVSGSFTDGAAKVALDCRTGHGPVAYRETGAALLEERGAGPGTPRVEPSMQKRRITIGVGLGGILMGIRTLLAMETGYLGAVEE